jgi:hypothetical protein
MYTASLRPRVSAFLRRVRIGALVVILKGLMWLINTRRFRIVLRVLTFPILYPWILFHLLRLPFGYKPKLLGMKDTRAIRMWEQIEATRNAPMTIEGDTEPHRRLMQALTWGVAGFAILTLIQVITSESPHSSARWVACGCFALVVPWLGSLGWRVSSELDSKTPPTVQQSINTFASIYAGILVFCIGFASLLWSYSPSISGLFILGCVVAVRRVVSYSKKLVATTPPPASSIIRLP